jgi:hypothetical protein
MDTIWTVLRVWSAQSPTVRRALPIVPARSAPRDTTSVQMPVPSVRAAAATATHKPTAARRLTATIYSTTPTDPIAVRSLLAAVHAAHASTTQTIAFPASPATTYTSRPASPS